MPGSQSPYLTYRQQKGTSLAAAANGNVVYLSLYLLTDYKPEILLAGQFFDLFVWLVHWLSTKSLLCGLSFLLHEQGLFFV